MKTTYKQIASQLSYSPSFLPLLNSHINHYSRTKKVRLATAILACLLIALNGYLIISPPQSSVATSNNDIIYGGLGNSEINAQKALSQIWSNNQNPGGNKENDIQSLLGYFGATQEDINNAKLVEICSDCSEQDKKLKVLGRNTGLPMKLESAELQETYYLQSLNTLDGPTGSSKHKALQIKKDFYVLMASGNIVFIDEPKSELSVVVSPINKDGKPQHRPGNTPYYRIYFSNEGEATAHQIKIEVEIPDGYEILDTFPESNVDNYTTGQQTALFELQELNNQSNTEYFDVAISPNQSVNSSELLCVEANLSALDTEQVSNTYCSDKENSIYTKESGHSTSAPFVQPPPTDPEHIPSDELQIHISSKNLDTKSSTAQPLDRIVYTVDIHNKTLENINNHELAPVNLADALEYANVSKLNGAILTGEELNWPLVDLKSGEHIQKTFEITVHKNLAQTSRSSVNHDSFDCMININYGSVTENAVNCGITKAVEQSIHTLPTINTATLVVSLTSFSALATYYFYHNRHLHKELVALQKHYAYSHRSGLDG